MRARELRDLSPDELEQKERELREELFRLRLRRGASQLENAMKPRLARRDLARVLTIRKQREKEGQTK